MTGHGRSSRESGRVRPIGGPFTCAGGGGGFSLTTRGVFPIVIRMEANQPRRKPLTVAGVLASALDMEDQMSHGVYRDYLNRTLWPKPLSDEAFAQIREMLTTLLNETAKHERMITTLRTRLTDDERTQTKI